VLALLQLDVDNPVSGPVPMWWVWLLAAIAMLVIIVYLVGRIGPGGPWARP
jgi:hypothetical protein